MKKIHFDNLGKNKYWIIIILLSLVLIFIEELPIEFENPKIYKYLRASGFLLQVIYWSKLFWFKNTVQWNKKGAVIRINSFMGKSLSFDQIKKTELNENKLIITKTGGEIITFDLNEIAESDTQKLNEIIAKNTIANNVYN
mgnify:CR=1 FL=1|tara:strand:+ start:269 stop:691 length:423 start_codon:yes stop_codon:yes gene_type:complete